MGSHHSIDGNIRPKSASQMLPNTQQFLDVGEDVDPLRNFNVAPPSAAVIGAGVAGVHAAYELGKLGFAVTVFEEKDSVAAGETQYSLPFVGVGLIKPSLARVSLRQDLLKNVFPSSCPSIIARDHLFNTLFSSPLHRWLLARFRGGAFNEEEIMFYTDNLSRVSYQTVVQLAATHPALQEHIRCGDVRVTALEATRASAATADGGSTRELVLAKTAHPRPIMVDPVGWTRTLGSICQEKFNVRFALGERLESFHTYLKYSVETTRSIRISRQHPEDPSSRVYADEAFDVIVLTAGARTGALTSQTARLPIVGLSGVAVAVENAVGTVAKDMKRLFSGTSAAVVDAATERDASLVLLSDKCNLFGYRFVPRHAQPQQRPSLDACPSTPVADGKEEVPSSPAAVGGASERFTMTGLLSLDTTQPSEEATTLRDQAAALQNLSRMEAFVRVMCDQEVPLVECVGGGGSGASGAPSTADVVATSYTRAFTPDGVPIIDHCGGAFNTFVCSGFGDQAMDFAPGAAKILGQLVRHQAEMLLEEDVQRQKALGLAAMAAGDEKGVAVANLPLPKSKLQEVEAGMQMLLNGRLPEDDSTASSAKRSVALPGNVARWLARLTGSRGSVKATTDVRERLPSPQQLEGADADSATLVREAQLPVQEWRTAGLPRLPSPEARESPDLKDSRGETFLHFSGNPFSTNRFGTLVKKGFRDINVHTPTSYLDAAENAIFDHVDPIRQRVNRAANQLARRDNMPAFVKAFVYHNMYYDGDDAERAREEGEKGLQSRQRVLAMREADPESGWELLQQSKVAQEERERRAREARVADLHAPSYPAVQH